MARSTDGTRRKQGGRGKLPLNDPAWASLPASFEAATAAGVEQYFEGKPCANGHVAARYVSNKRCVVCNREQGQQQRQRQMAEEGTEVYYESEAARHRGRYARTPEVREKQRERYKRGERTAAIWAKRVPPWITKEERKAMRAYCRNRPEGHDVDHIVELRGELICGLHVLANLQYLERREHRKKRKPTYTHDEALELIRLGLAVWTSDIGDDGVIDWSAYRELVT